MNGELFPMEPVERLVYGLRGLYESYGYKKYRMSKFEEYDLYLENKSFLPSQQVVTFTDLNGRLLALKPDVTLSIAKNAPAEAAEPLKVYYNENVYRSPAGSGEFREIYQVGLEYMGDVDLYSQCEVIDLACGSLSLLGGKWVMTLSHMGFVSGLLESCGLSPGDRERAMSLVDRKNAHGLRSLCEKAGLPPEKGDMAASLTELYGGFDETLERAKALVSGEKMARALESLAEIRRVLGGRAAAEELRLDFSVINDLSYYNGLIFQGFIQGVPRAVLSGGRYDRLMEKLGKRIGAIGFAVYVNELERLSSGSEAEAGVILVSGENDAAQVMAAAGQLRNQGIKVRVQSRPPEKPGGARVLTLREGRLTGLE